jgi:hypothetical protein
MIGIIGDMELCRFISLIMIESEDFKRSTGWGQEDTDLISDFQQIGLQIVRLSVPNYEYHRLIEKDEFNSYYSHKNKRDRKFPITPEYYPIERHSIEHDAVELLLNREQESENRVQILELYFAFSPEDRGGYYPVLWRNDELFNGVKKSFVINKFLSKIDYNDLTVTRIK